MCVVLNILNVLLLYNMTVKDTSVLTEKIYLKYIFGSRGSKGAIPTVVKSKKMAAVYCGIDFMFLLSHLLPGSPGMLLMLYVSG